MTENNHPSQGGPSQGGPSQEALSQELRLAQLEAENARLRQSLADAEQTTGRLALELQHRVRNILAVLRSVVRRTASTAGTAEDYAMHLGGRLNTIARVNAMTTRDPAKGTGLEILLLEEMLAHAAHKDGQVTLSGPPVELTGKAGELVALAIHELTVNAVKFGALSTPHGRITVTWHVGPPLPANREAAQRRGNQAQDGPMLLLEWRETGGPPIPAVPPPHKGFGTGMIEQTLPYELDASATLAFTPDGLCCKVALPLTALQPVNIPS